MGRQPVDGKAFTDIPWQSTAVLWGPDSDQPAELDIKGYGLARMLSHDPETGATSLLIKEPPGWHTAAAEAHSVLQEDILLEGDCWYGEEHFEGPTYFCFPPDHFHGPMFTETGALWLVTLTGDFDVRYSDEVRSGDMSWWNRANTGEG
ncbi:MAG: hypothetical protein ACI8TP_000590 [Acidimicrobiales bacterium]|jgi:hypothetical protein